MKSGGLSSPHAIRPEVALARTFSRRFAAHEVPLAKRDANDKNKIAGDCQLLVMSMRPRNWLLSARRVCLRPSPRVNPSEALL